MTRYYYEKYNTKTTLEEKMRKYGNFSVKDKASSYFNGYKSYEIKNGKFSISTNYYNGDVFGMDPSRDYKGTLYRPIFDSYVLKPNYECDTSDGKFTTDFEDNTIESPYLYAVNYDGWKMNYKYYSYRIYSLENVTNKDSLLDKFIAEEGIYPINGVKNGYWYVRGQKIVPELKDGSKSMKIETVIKIGGGIRDVTPKIKLNGRLYDL